MKVFDISDIGFKCQQSFFFLISEKWKIKKNEKTPWRYWKISVIRNAWYLVFTCDLVMDKPVGGLTGTFRTSFMDINLNLSFPSQRQFYNWPISYRLWKGFVRKLKKRNNSRMFFHLFKVYPLNGKANNYHICEFSVEKFRLLHLTHLCNKISYLLVYHVNVFPNIPTNRRRCKKSAFKDFFENPPNVILHCKENNL